MRPHMKWLAFPVRRQLSWNWRSRSSFISVPNQQRTCASAQCSSCDSQQDLWDVSEQCYLVLTEMLMAALFTQMKTPCYFPHENFIEVQGKRLVVEAASWRMRSSWKHSRLFLFWRADRSILYIYIYICILSKYFFSHLNLQCALKKNHTTLKSLWVLLRLI